MIRKETVTQIAEEHLSGSDAYLVEVEVSADNRIVVEIDTEQGVSIDACVALSRYIESKLDREAEDYELEVGSPALGQPFKVRQQYRKFAGSEVEVLTTEGEKFCGILQTVTDEGITLELSYLAKPEGAKRKKLITENKLLNYSEIKYTKYIIRFK